MAPSRRPPRAPNDVLIEVDGKLVPNYDATIKPFEEGDVVSGEVVRIDKDEVLVDIGYKSEGVIPSTELSIRRSVDPAEEVVAGRARRRAGAHQGGPGGAAAAVQEARPLREGLAQDRGRGRVRRAGRGNGDRGRQGRPDPRPRRPRLPARFAGRHPSRPQPGRVQGPDARVQGDRAQPQPQQRRALAPRRARGGAQGGPRADPGSPPARHGRRGQDLQHRRLRRLRRPRRDRRADPHLRAFLEPRQPSLRGPLGRRDGEREGARHRPRAPADLAGPEADPGGSVAQGARGIPPRRRRSRARSPRWSRSAPSSRSSPGSRGWSTSRSSPSTTSRIPARSSRPATRPG